MRLVASHAPLDLDDPGEVEAVLARARAAGVVRIVCIGLWRGPGDFGNALALAAADPAFLAATIGIHPHDAARVPEADWAAAEALAADPRVSAIGETGLDFHYDLSPRDVQDAAFRRSLRTAHRVGKPV